MDLDNLRRTLLLGETRRQNRRDDSEKDRSASGGGRDRRHSRAISSLAYVLAPFFWRHFEHQPRARGHARRPPAPRSGSRATRSMSDLREPKTTCCARCSAAGWRPADPVTLSSSLRIAGSVLFDRPYQRRAGQPPLLRQPQAGPGVRKARGRKARTKRHHVRFWSAPWRQARMARRSGSGPRPTIASVGFSHRTGQITHHIAADVDAERDLLDRVTRRTAVHVAATYPRQRDRGDPDRPQRRRRSLFHRRRHYGVQAGLGLRGLRSARRSPSPTRLGSRRRTRSSHGSRRFGAALP